MILWKTEYEFIICLTCLQCHSKLSPDGWAKVRPQRSQATFFFTRPGLQWASDRWRWRARWLASFLGHCGHCSSQSCDMEHRLTWANSLHLKSNLFLHQTQMKDLDTFEGEDEDSTIAFVLFSSSSVCSLLLSYSAFGSGFTFLESFCSSDSTVKRHGKDRNVTVKIRIYINPKSSSVPSAWSVFLSQFSIRESSSAGKEDGAFCWTARSNWSRTPSVIMPSLTLHISFSNTNLGSTSSQHWDKIWKE